MKHNVLNLMTRVVLVLLAGVWLTGCEEDNENNDAPTNPNPEGQSQLNIVEYAQSEDNLSTLVDAVMQADLVDALADESAEFTVFAPTNSAFADFLQANPDVSELSEIPAEVLGDVLQYHVVSGTVLAADLENGSVNTLLDGESIEVNVDDGVVLNGSVRVTDADNIVSNGVVHLIDEVLVPPSLMPEANPTIAAIASDTEALSILVQALQRTPDLLATADNADADITVFAPTNDAFADLLSALEADGLDDIPDYVLRRVLEYHILGSGKLASELDMTEATLEGAEISIDKSNGVVINESSNVVADLADIEAANGVVHVIDEVLIPPFIAQVLGTALQPLVFDAEGRFTLLATALETQSDLVDFFVNTGDDGTIFAPTNAAFEALIASNDALSSAEDLLALDNLADILLYHVAADRKASSDLKGASAATHSRLLNPNTGSPLEIYYSNEDDGRLILLGYSNVVEANIMTPNDEFIIHAIDAVLMPPTASIVGVAATNPQFSELVAALTRVEEASGINEDLLPLVTILGNERGEQSLAPFTVFAPTNAAFEALYAALGVSGVGEIDPATLQAVLLYHVVSGEPVFSTDLDQLEGGKAETLGGTFTVNRESLTIADANADNEDAEIIGTNVIATNGVVHVVDQVLLPELSH